MEDIFVGQLMSSPVYTVTLERPAHEAAEKMLAQDIGSLVVVGAEDDRPEGIVTATDFVRLVADREATDDTTVDAVVTPVTTTATVNDTIRDAAEKMMTDGIHHLPVVDDGSLVGILTSTDLTAYLSPEWTPSPA